MKEGREVVLVLSCHPSNITLYTLSLFLFNGYNLKLEEEEQQQLQTRLQISLKSDLPSFGNPRGLFIGIRGTGTQGTRSDPKRRTRRGHQVAARAALRAARSLFCLLSVLVPGFVF